MENNIGVGPCKRFSLLRVLCAFVLAFGLIPSAAFAQVGSASDGEGGTEYVIDFSSVDSWEDYAPGELLIEFKEDVSVEEAMAYLALQGWSAEFSNSIWEASSGYSKALCAHLNEGQDVFAAKSIADASDLVLYSGPNGYLYADDDIDQSKVDFAYRELVSVLQCTGYDAGVGKQLDKYGISIAEFKLAAQRIFSDPEYYFATGKCTVTASYTGIISRFECELAVSSDRLSSYKATFEKSAAEALLWVNSSMTDVLKAQALHDYLIRSVSQGQVTSTSSTQESCELNSAYGALVNGAATSKGYSAAYRLLLSRAGISCDYATAIDGSCRWNMLQLDGEWYHVDAAGDDPAPDAGFSSEVSHARYLLSDNEMVSLGYTKWDTEYEAANNYPAYDYPVFDSIAERVPALDVSLCDISFDKSARYGYGYTGRQIRPEITLVSNGFTLREGIDYEVSFANNVDPGEATAFIKGINGVSGSVEEQFTINKSDYYNDFKLRRVDGTEYSWLRDDKGTAVYTAAHIARLAFPQGSDWVILARDDDFADAMSASGLAGVLDAPIVLTDRNGLSRGARDVIKDLGAKHAYVIGGFGAMPGNFEGDLGQLGIEVGDDFRIAGEEAYDTSVACAQKIVEHGGSCDYAIVASGQSFQDALSMSSFAYKYGAAIFLETYGGQSSDRILPQAAKEMLLNDGAFANAKVFVPGGPAAVSLSSVEGVVGQDLRGGARIYGNNAFDTCNQVAKWMVENDYLSAKVVCVANGAEAPRGVDALAGSALAGKKGGVILLANTNAAFGEVGICTLKGADSEGGDAFLESHAKEVLWAYALGGKAVIPSDIEEILESLMGTKMYEPFVDDATAG